MRLLHFTSATKEYVVFLEDDDNSEAEDHQRHGFKLQDEHEIEFPKSIPLLGFGDVYMMDR